MIGVLRNSRTVETSDMLGDELNVFHIKNEHKYLGVWEE